MLTVHFYGYSLCFRSKSSRKINFPHFHQNHHFHLDVILQFCYTVINEPLRYKEETDGKYTAARKKRIRI